MTPPGLGRTNTGGESVSATIVDMPKVAGMLDAGWRVQMWKNKMGSYYAVAKHDNVMAWDRAKERCLKVMIDAGWSESEAKALSDEDFDTPGRIQTDDFTPEQALTRLAYKVHGEIL